MLPNRLIKGFDKRGLRRLLALIFLALAIPTAVLIWQAYGQLKWEAYHQHRIAAEELTHRIDARLNELIVAVDAQKFGDYAFLVVSGDPSANFVQRSPLSAYPIIDDVPGAMGYFQVDSTGVFSTPLLPPSGTPPVSLGISNNEYQNRLRVASDLQAVLTDNRLLRARAAVGLERRVLQFSPAATVPVNQAEVNEADSIEFDKAAVSGVILADPEVSAEPEETLQAATAHQDFRDVYRQEVFDDLNQPQRQKLTYAPQPLDELQEIRKADDSSRADLRRNSAGKVSDLKLDLALQKKSERVEAKEQGDLIASSAGSRSKRRETTALPESFRDLEKDKIANLPEPAAIRISTFESEIDPFEFSLLDSGHFVLFRKVWRGGERYIQGVLIEQESFMQDIFEQRFGGTALAEMSNLIVAYQDDLIFERRGRINSSYSNLSAALSGELLYRSRFAAPFGNLEVIFSLTRLPAGPGGNVLAWVTVVLAIVFAGGFLTLYRLGLSQISLARQQQDFVSAVSHELKSPLTSIRMYGEMLKEGWADEDKRQSYYEFIHDEAERLSRLISNVLQLASITRNEPQFDCVPVNVAELMSNTESKIASQIERAGFALTMSSDEAASDVSIDIDEDCFAQIIINLVDNAIKFSRNADNKTIEIRSQLSSDGQVLFSVRDYGPGVAKDQMKKIFQLFYRSESELTRETVGTGIGLAIVHQLTAAMNGSVDLVNADPGAEFKLRFPAIKP
jgi:signal transduction histidine kinase